jgi:hypothetical protein
MLSTLIASSRRSGPLVVGRPLDSERPGRPLVGSHKKGQLAARFFLRASQKGRRRRVASFRQGQVAYKIIRAAKIQLRQ